MAELLKYSDPSPGSGGEFEKLCFQTLRDKLPSSFLIATNVPIVRNKATGAFYECDAIVIAPGVCDILEMKSFLPYVEVYEDSLKGINEFYIDRALSSLDSKGKVLKSRREKPPFPKSSPEAHSPWIQTFVVIPDECEIKIKYEPYKKKCNIRRINEIVLHYSELARNKPLVRNMSHSTELLNAWKKFHDMSCGDIQKNNLYLGRYLIKRRLGKIDNTYEYKATDVPPCPVDVHLKEYPFDSLTSAESIQKSLKKISKEMKSLRHIRHQHVACVVGHFQTGSSLVQVSDWFEGKSIEDSWSTIKEITFMQKLDLFLKIIQALHFCHTQGVFHRALSAQTVLVNENMDDLRLIGFEFAKDLNMSTILMDEDLCRRDPRIIPPENIRSSGIIESRLSDVFQAGILFYRLLEDGAWPFADTITYCESNGEIYPLHISEKQSGMDVIYKLIKSMLSIVPRSRPYPLEQVVGEIRKVLSKYYL